VGPCLGGCLETDGDWVITIVRIVLGVVFFSAHGSAEGRWVGLAGQDCKAQCAYSESNCEFPAPLALLSVAAEFSGRFWGLIVGLLSRIAALGHCSGHDCRACLRFTGSSGSLLTGMEKKTRAMEIEYHNPGPCSRAGGDGQGSRRLFSGSSSVPTYLRSKWA